MATGLLWRDKILSRPAEVWWDGFRSNTYELTRAGWKIAVEEVFHRDQIRLLLRSEQMDLYALSDYAPWHYFNREDHFYNATPRCPLVFRIVQVAKHFEVTRMYDDFTQFRQIDGQPRYIEERYKSIDDFRIFALHEVKTEDIIVEPATVAGLLGQIRQMQVPEQERIRQKQRLAEAREQYPVQTTHAQIITLSDYRQAT